MNVLAIGAHFDDIELGCGGAIAKHVQQGDHVIGFVATNSQYGDRKGVILRESDIAIQEGRQASQLIGYQLLLGNIPTFYLEYGEEINVQLIRIIEENKIDLIYTHWIHDAHHDHRNLALATLHIARHINKILMYRSNWYISEKEFQENFYVDITQTWEIKKQAIMAYKSEYMRVGDRWIEYFRREAKNNGLKVGVAYAEAFQIVKWML